MNFKMMGRFIGQIVALEAVFMIPALIISLCNGESAAVQGFLVAMIAILLLGGVLFLLCRKAGKLFGAREGFVCVSLSWVILSLLGALPFWISREIPHYMDAFFETVSGLPPPAHPFFPMWKA